MIVKLIKKKMLSVYLEILAALVDGNYGVEIL
jgi:hypothetical protein